MAYSFALTAALAGVNKTATAAGEQAESSVSEVSLAPSADDVEVQLGTLSVPKVIVVMGGKGVSVRLVAVTGTVFPADPMAMLADTAGLAQTSIFLSNSDSQEHKVTILACE